MYRNHIFFIHSAMHRHLGCFHVLAIVNNAAVSMGCIYLFELVILFPLDKYPGLEFLDHMVVPFFIFFKNSSAVSHTVCTSLHSHQQCPRIPFSRHPGQLLLFVFYLLFGNSHFNECKFISHHGFALYFPDNW